MKKVCTLFLLSVISLGLMAQNVINGVVKFRGVEQNAVGITVTLGSTNQKTVTNANGEFKIETDKVGDDVLILSGQNIINYQRMVNIQVGKNDVGEILISADEQSSVKDEMMFTISEEEFDIDGASSQNVSGLLYSKGDPFTSGASYQFSPMRFRIRGLDGMYNQTYVNGISMNDAERGFFTYSQIGGLNDFVRNKENVNGIESSNFTFGNIGGSVNINARASAVRKGFKVSQVASNRTYTTRTMATYATGLMNNGWAFAISASYRWAKDGYAKGTFYDAWAFAVAAEKRFNQKHSLSLTILGAPTHRGMQSGSTQEAYDLTPKDNFFFMRCPVKKNGQVVYGNNNYNANWGYQNGKMRNAKQVKAFTPIAILSHEWNIDDASKLTTSIGYKCQMDGRTAMNWYKAADPRPDYYRNLPNYFVTRDDQYSADLREELWRTDENYRQINWDRMYQTNFLANNSGKSGRYMIENRRNDQHVITLNSVLNYKFNESWKLDGGLELQSTLGRHFKLVDDLLGADYWVDIDQYGERDNPGDMDFMQNDLNNRDRRITPEMLKSGKMSDRIFGYDYHINNNTAKLWAQAKYAGSHVDVYFGAQAKYTDFWRVGNMLNGRSSDWVDLHNTFNGNDLKSVKHVHGSFGSGAHHNFLTYAVKAGLNYRINGRHILALNVAHGTNAPLTRNAYFSQRVRPDVIPFLKPEMYVSADLSYYVRTPIVNGRLTIYNTNFWNSSELSSFYNDGYKTFVNFAMYDYNKRHTGAELGLEFNVGGGFSIEAIAAVGQNIYTSNPMATISTENGLPLQGYDNSQVNERIYAKGFHLDGTPEIATSIGFHYFHPSYWFFDVNVNYFTNTYMDFNPFRRTFYAIKGLGGIESLEQLGINTNDLENVNMDNALYDHYSSTGIKSYQMGDVRTIRDIRKQERLNGGVTLDVSVGKSIRINYKYFLNINLSASNILNNRRISTGGYEQSRFSTVDERTDRATYLKRFPSKYFYAYGATIYLNVGFRF